MGEERVKLFCEYFNCFIKYPPNSETIPEPPPPQVFCHQLKRTYVPGTRSRPSELSRVAPPTATHALLLLDMSVHACGGCVPTLPLIEIFILDSYLEWS